MFQTFNNTGVYWHICIYIMHSTGHYKGITQVPTKVWPTTSTLGTDSIVSSLCTVQTTDTGAFSGACSALPANRAPTDKCCTHRRCVSSRGSWCGRAGSTAGWMPSDRCHIWTGAHLKWKLYGLQLMKKQPDNLPVCDRLCRLRSSFDLNVLEQNSQLKIFSTSMGCSSRWRFSWSAASNVLLHLSHLKKPFALVCSFMCTLKRENKLVGNCSV